MVMVSGGDTGISTITSVCEYRKRIYIMIILETIMKIKEAEKMSKNDDKAFDTKVALGDGSELFLSDLWKKQPLVLIFLRHLG